MNSKEHPARSPNQLIALALGVRLEHLSEEYLHHVLPNLEWFIESCCDEEACDFLRILLLRKSRPDVGYGACSNWEGPPAWSSGKRKGTALPESATLFWDLEPQDILEMDTIANPMCDALGSPQNTYINGVFVKLRAQRGGADAAVTLAVYLCPDVQAMQAALGSWDCSMHPLFYSGELWASTAMKSIGPEISSSPGQGFKDIFGRSAASIAEVVAPYLVDGRLSLKAVIKAA